MNRRAYYLFSLLIGVGLLSGGCSTTTGPAVSSYDPNKPQTFLAGAEVEHAKSLAMGSAVSKGWKIVDSSGDKLLASRPLDATAAQALAGGPVSTASVEVRSDFYQRQQGVDVVLSADLLKNAGTDTEERIPFTESYRSDLNRSLGSLRQAWEENRSRVTSSPPLYQPRDARPANEGAPAAEGEGFTNSQATPEPMNESVAAWGDAVESATEPVAVSGASGSGAPIEDRSAAAPLPPASTSNATVSPAENMLVLNRTAEPGVWAYYAEHYAKIRGCDVTDKGAILEGTQSGYEVHGVACKNGQSFRVKCNAGTCIGLE